MNDENLPFDKMILAATKRRAKSCEFSERKRVSKAVTMVMRYRGDMFGFFDSGTYGQGRWEDVPSRGLMSRNIFMPVVRSNSTNFMQAAMRVTATACNSDPEVDAGVQIAQSLVDYFDKRDWHPSAREELCQLGQLTSNYFVYTYPAKDSDADAVLVPEMSPLEEGDTQALESVGQEYVCGACGHSQPIDGAPEMPTAGTRMFNEPEALGMGAQPAEAKAASFFAPTESAGGPPCPECNEPMEKVEGDTEFAVQQIPQETHTGYSEIEGAEIFRKVISSFEMRVDELNAKGGDISKAEWVNYHPLVRGYEIKRKWKWMEGKLPSPKAGAWSRSTMWKHSLETGNSLGTYEADETGDDALFEVNYWWFSPKWNLDWKSPGRYEHPSGKFDIEQGETIQQAFDRLGKEYVGLFVGICGEEEMGMVDTECLKERWSSGGWMTDSTSFWCKAQEDLEMFQEAITEMTTLFFEYAMHDSLPHTIIDGKMFDRKDFKNKAGGISYTRKGYMRDRPIGDYIHQLNAGQISSTLGEIYNGFLNGAQDTVGVQPSTVGAPDETDSTYKGQLLKRNQSVGLLGPSLRSFARCKLQAMKQALKLAQKYYAEGRYLPVKGKWGNEWKKADIKAFQALDLDKDMYLDIAEGSDVPMTNDERVQKIGGLIGSGILAPEAGVPEQLKSMMFAGSGIDYDPGDFAADIRSAHSRLRHLTDRIEDLRAAGIDYIPGPEFITDPMTGQVQPDPATVEIDPMSGQPLPGTGQPMPNPMAGQPTLNLEALMQILSEPNIKILPRTDNHKTHTEYYNDKIKALAAEEPVNEPLLQACLMRVDEHFAQIVQNAADEMAAQGMVQQMGMAAAGQPPQGQDPNAGKPSPEQQAQGDKDKDDRAHGSKKELKGMELEHASKEKDKDRETQVKIAGMSALQNANSQARGNGSSARK